MTPSQQACSLFLFFSSLQEAVVPASLSRVPPPQLLCSYLYWKLRQIALACNKPAPSEKRNGPTLAASFANLAEIRPQHFASRGVAVAPTESGVQVFVCLENKAEKRAIFKILKEAEEENV